MEYLMNAWYCVGWSADLRDAPVGRTVLEQPIVLYRDGGGNPVALDGRCPHRFAPLAKGEVVGDTILCPYHGLRFDRAGMCVHNPHGAGQIPPNAKVRPFPVAEKDGALWVWPGDAEKADPSRLPDPHWLHAPDYACVTGYLRVEANYQLVIDNLLDLTHAPYLHRNTVGGDPEDSIGSGMEHDFHTDRGNVIHSNYLVRGMPKPTPQMLPLWGNNPGDFRAEMRWHPASTLELDIRMSPPGAAGTEGVHVPSLHYLAPESEDVTHYFYAMGRNVQIEDHEQTRMMGEFARRAFEEEDEPMIKECQRLMGTTDLFSLRPAILQTDIAGVQARRLLGKLIREERQDAAA